MNTPKPFTETIKDALAKKQAAQHPDSKTKGGASKVKSAGSAPKGPPQRRAVSRGG